MTGLFSEWLDYIYALHPREIDLGLSRMTQVAKQLGGLQPQCPVVMVAGTNGKGSLVKLTQALLQQQGLRVGCYTSPHLHSFCERISIDGEPIAEQELLGLFARVEEARGESSLSFFEFTTLAALLHFKDWASAAHNALDVVILEVGLGGRLDAVNVVDADVAVITTLGIDHTEHLGDDLESIGREKAGIFRANKWAILGLGEQDLPQSVASLLQDLRAPALQMQRDFNYSVGDSSWQLVLDGKCYQDLPPGQLPIHAQALALVVLSKLHDLGVGQGIDLAACGEVLATTSLPGRLQRLEHHAIDHILDVAHNEDSCIYLARALRAKNLGKVRAVFSALADKKVTAMLEPLLGLIDHWLVGGMQHVMRGQSGDAIAALMQQLAVDNDIKLAVAAHDTVTEAYREALDMSKPGDTIVVFGSFYTVAEVLAVVESRHCEAVG